jgi:hypothetical protein
MSDTLVLLILLGGIGAAGYYLYQTRKDERKQQGETGEGTDVPPPAKSWGDLLDLKPSPFLGVTPIKPYVGDLPKGHDFGDLDLTHFNSEGSYSFIVDREGHVWDYSNRTWAQRPDQRDAQDTKWTIGRRPPTTH